MGEGWAHNRGALSKVASKATRDPAVRDSLNSLQHLVQVVVSKGNTVGRCIELSTKNSSAFLL